MAGRIGERRLMLLGLLIAVLRVSCHMMGKDLRILCNKMLWPRATLPRISQGSGKRWSWSMTREWSSASAFLGQPRHLRLEGGQSTMNPVNVWCRIGRSTIPCEAVRDGQDRGEVKRCLGSAWVRACGSVATRGAASPEPWMLARVSPHATRAKERPRKRHDQQYDS